MVEFLQVPGHMTLMSSQMRDKQAPGDAHWHRTALAERVLTLCHCVCETLGVIHSEVSAYL